MAFTQTKGRYASFGIVTSLPKECIDSVWYIIDHYLKHTIPLKNIVTFYLTKRNNLLSLTFSQEGYRKAITIDLHYPYDPFFPNKIIVFDRKGEETICLPHELNHY